MLTILTLDSLEQLLNVLGRELGAGMGRVTSSQAKLTAEILLEVMDPGRPSVGGRSASSLGDHLHQGIHGRPGLRRRRDGGKVPLLLVGGGNLDQWSMTLVSVDLLKDVGSEKLVLDAAPPAVLVRSLLSAFVEELTESVKTFSYLH